MWLSLFRVLNDQFYDIILNYYLFYLFFFIFTFLLIFFISKSKYKITAYVTDRKELDKTGNSTLSVFSESRTRNRHRSKWMPACILSASGVSCQKVFRFWAGFPPPPIPFENHLNTRALIEIHSSTDLWHNRPQPRNFIGNLIAWGEH